MLHCGLRSRNVTKTESVPFHVNFSHGFSVRVIAIIQAIIYSTLYERLRFNVCFDFPNSLNYILEYQLIALYMDMHSKHS